MDELPFCLLQTMIFRDTFRFSKKSQAKIKHIALSGGTDTRRLAHAGISSIGFGAGNNQAHEQ